MVKAPQHSKGKTRTAHPDVSLPDHVLDKKVKEQASEAVLDKTIHTYQKKIWTMKDWLAKRKKPTTPITDADLSRFLASHGGGVKNGNTAKHWRSAAKKWRTLEGVVEENSAATALLDTQIKGITYQGGRAIQTAADVIDSGRLGEMTKLLCKWGYEEYALHFIFVFYTMFRKTRGGNVLAGDIRFGTDIGTVIASKRAKFANSQKCGPGAIGNFKEVHNLTAFLKELMKGKKADDRLFPNYVEKTANDVIKRCAKTLGWGEGKWCVNSLRHAGSREAMAVLEDEPSLPAIIENRRQKGLSKRMGHSNTISKKRYQNSHGSRGKKRDNRTSRVSGLF